MRILFLLPLFFIITFFADAQNEKMWQAGFEFQGYPAGFIIGARLEHGWNLHHAVHVRGGYNFAYHRDLGVHENEEGGGPGFTLGYRYYFREEHRGLFLGIRNDLWFNSIDWKDNIDLATEMTGTTDIIVLQPTLEGGYQFVLSNDHLYITPAIAFGIEWNVKEDGAEVGEGAILLLGINIGYRF